MTRCLFIGIDQHLHPAIRELTGARRDATALWTLFSDSVADLDAECLTDEQATVAKARTALDEVFSNALAEDTVIVSFSGHGTHDHRLVFHDTSPDTLADSTIPMEYLADCFKKSKAGRVLCILDCCFSGGAPARVLEDSPIPRHTTPSLEALAGAGRILLAASNTDEAAYELPTERHGLLTRALVEILRKTEEPVSLPGILDEVMACVRADAARLGVVQTPVLLGYVEGGLTLPALRPGKRFFAAFPELRGARIERHIEELEAFGLPSAALDEWATRFPDGLNDLQLASVNDHRVLDGDSVLVIAPTSAGKTFVGEMAAIRAHGDGRKAVFLLPYRALVNEKHEDFSALYGDRLGLRVVRCTGDYLDQTAEFVRGRYDIAVLTYEMFLNLALANPSVLNHLGLVVLDEGQFITDPTRGIVVELLLTYVLTAKDRGVSPQLLVLSATIGDVNGFDKWLECSCLVTTKRPVPLLEGVMDRLGQFQALGPEDDERTVQLIPSRSIVQRRDKPSAQDIIVPLVRELVRSGEKVLLFRNKRGSASGAARYLAKELGLPAATVVATRLPTKDLSSTSADLRDCLAGGTAFHNTNLARQERVVVEQAFRDPEGPLRVLVTTTTLAAGINTPASTVILAEHEFVGPEARPFTVAEYKNMSGRAGRTGFREEGKAILLANNALERDRLFRTYPRGTPDAVRSSFDPRQLDTWVVRLLTQASSVPRDDVVRLLASTYGGYLAGRQDPAWRTGVQQQLNELLEEMLSLELLQDDGKNVSLTLLGRACGNSSLAFRSALRLVSSLRELPPEHLNATSLMALIQGLPELDKCYTPLARRGRQEAVWPAEAARRYDGSLVARLQRDASATTDYYARCKRVLILHDWISGTPVQQIEDRYTTNPFYSVGYGDIRAITDSTRFHLRSASEIASLLFVEHGSAEEEIEALLRQIELGIPLSAVPLLDLDITLTRGEYLALQQAEITSPDAVLSLQEDALAEILGPARAKEMQRLRSKL